MNIRYVSLSVVLAGILTGEALCQTYYQAPPSRSKSLGLFGGLAGAGIGAAIGQKGGDALPGAAIGGTIGALSGAILGNAADQDEARRRAYMYSQQQEYGRLAQRVTIADVVTMTHAGLADDVIINQIRSKGMAQTLSTNDLITLKQQAVSDRVINAMQYQPQPTRIVRQPSPVIVEEHYYHPRYYPPTWHYRSHYDHHPHHHPHSGIHFSFGH